MTARGDPRQAHRDPGNADERLSRAAAVRAGLRGGRDAVRSDRGRRRRKERPTSGCSSTKASSPSPTKVCTSSRTSANGGSARRAFPSRWAATSSERTLGADLTQKISRHLHDSIAYGLDHRKAALDHSMQYARGLDRSKADTFVGMYVNDWTLDYGERGRQAVRDFLQRGVESGLISKPVTVEFVD